MTTPAPPTIARPCPEFTSDWFSARIPQWTAHIVPALAGKPVRALTLGCYEGRSDYWILENILTHPDARIICVDAWPGSMKVISDRFDANILGSPHAAKVTKIRAQCFDALRWIAGPLDLVYVDADHQAKSALQDAAMVWPLIAKGGFLIFDDYLWKQPDHAKLPPKPGIDAFLELWKGEYETLHLGYQVILKKL